MKDLTYNEFQLIDIDSIVANDQVRRKFNKEEVDGLAASISTSGLINPITIAGTGDGKYRVVAGERRLRACKLLGHDKIPAIIIEADENRLMEIQLVENCQRKDINPIEELDAFTTLLMNGYRPEDISRQIGKPQKYVHTRLKLAGLSDHAKSLLFNDDIDLSHCRYLCVMSKEIQEKALETLMYETASGELKYLPAKNFEDFFIKNQSIKLSIAHFDTSFEYPAMQPCDKCPHNSGVNTLLFDGISKEHICNDQQCFKAKTEIFISSKIKEWTGTGIEVIEASEHYSEVLPNIWEHAKVPSEEIDGEFKVGAMLIIVDGSFKRLGEHYPVYSTSQLKASEKAEVAPVQPKQGQKKVTRAIERFSNLVISRIAENHMKGKEKNTIGIKLLSAYKLYSGLDPKIKEGFFVSLSINTGDTDFYLFSGAEQAFFSNLGEIEKNIDTVLQELSLMHLSSTFVYKDEPQYAIIEKLAKESGTDIEKCRGEIEKESGIDLGEI